MSSPKTGTVEFASGDALLIVDMQNEFLPGGRLAIPRGDAVIPSLNRYITLFHGKALPIFASRDWHPADHCSFQGHGGQWPPHCIAGSPGAELAGDLMLPSSAFILSKATKRNRESYSAFDATGLAEKLREIGARRVFVGGLATEFCVLATVEDALKEGFQAVLLADAVRALDSQPGDGARAIQRMLQQGASAIGGEDLSA